MITDLHVRAVHRGQMRVTASAGEHAVEMDYPLAEGDAKSGLTPLETLLSALSACAANTLILVLAKMQQTVEGLEVIADAHRRTDHPTVLTDIALAFELRGADLDPAAVERAMTIAEDQLCPVWAMLKPGTPITASFRIV